MVGNLIAWLLHSGCSWRQETSVKLLFGQIPTCLIIKTGVSQCFKIGDMPSFGKVDHILAIT